MNVPVDRWDVFTIDVGAFNILRVQRRFCPNFHKFFQNSLCNKLLPTDCLWLCGALSFPLPCCYGLENLAL